MAESFRTSESVSRFLAAALTLATQTLEASSEACQFSFLFRTSSSHFTGLIGPLVLHHLSPVQIPKILVPSESHTRTAL